MLSINTFLDGGEDHGKNVPKVVGKGSLFAQCSV